MNPYVYCTMMNCSDTEWENLSPFGALIFGIFILLGVIGGIVAVYDKFKGKDMK